MWEGWLKQVDGKGNVFYFHQETRESSWKAPPGFVDKLPKGWVEALDGDVVYYFNLVTGESAWELHGDASPVDIGGAAVADESETANLDAVKDTGATPAPTSKDDLPEWVEMFDPGSGAYYFFNNKTFESLWEQPEGYVKPDLSKAQVLMAPEVRAALKMQSAFRARRARKAVRAQRGAKNATEGSLWTAIVDPQSGHTYYYNNETAKCTWDVPENFHNKEEETKENTEDAADPKAKPVQISLENKDTFDQPREIVEDVMEDLASTLAAEANNNDLPEWVEVFDPTNKAYYFLNQRTFESQWEEPEGYEKPEYKNIKHLMAPELKAAVMMQGAFRAKLARKAVRIQRAIIGIDENGPEWSEVHDPASGLPYFYNSVTGDVSWEKPEGLMPKEKEQAAEQPAEAAEQPAEAAEQPAEAAEQPAEVAEQPAEVMEQPAKVAEQPAKAAEQPAKAAEQPAKAAEQLTEAAEQLTEAVKEKSYPVWCTALDNNSDVKYYYNTGTGDVQWERPDDFDGNDEFADSDDVRSKELKLKMQAALEGKLKKVDPEMQERMRKVREEQAVAEAKAKRRWCEVYDESQDAFYYYDLDSYETVWERPLDFIMAASNEMLEAALKLQGIFRIRLAKKKARAKKAIEETKNLDPNEPPLWVKLEDNTTHVVYWFHKVKHIVCYDEPNAEMMEGKEPNKWCQAVDETSGSTYYYNVETNEVKWDPPAEFGDQNSSPFNDLDDERTKFLKERMKKALQGELKNVDAEMAARMRKAHQEQRKRQEAAGGRRWCEVYDDKSDKFYYYDVDTFETVWEKPVNFVMQASDELLKAALIVQSAWRIRMAKHSVRVERAKQKVKEMAAADDHSEKPWVELHDNDADAPFFFHKESGEVQWSGVSREYIYKPLKPIKRTIVRVSMPPEETKREDLGKENVAEATLTPETKTAEYSAVEEDDEPETDGDENDSEEARARLQRKKDRQAAKKEQQNQQEALVAAQSDARAQRAVWVKEQQAAMKAKKDTTRQTRVAKKAILMAEALKRTSAEEEARKHVREERLNAVRAQEEQQKTGHAAAKQKKYHHDKTLLAEWLALYNKELGNREAVDKEQRQQHQRLLERCKAATCKSPVAQQRPMFTTLWEAVAGEEADQGVLKSLLPRGQMFAKQRNMYSRTLLHEAVWLGCIPLVKSLLALVAEEGSDLHEYVNRVDSTLNCITALHECARAGWGAAMVNVLLESGASLTAKDRHGDCALHCASRHGHFSTSQALVRANDSSLETLVLPNFKRRSALDLSKSTASRSITAGECFAFTRSPHETCHALEIYDSICSMQ